MGNLRSWAVYQHPDIDVRNTCIPPGLRYSRGTQRRQKSQRTEPKMKSLPQGRSVWSKCHCNRSGLVVWAQPCSTLSWGGGREKSTFWNSVFDHKILHKQENHKNQSDQAKQIGTSHIRSLLFSRRIQYQLCAHKTSTTECCQNSPTYVREMKSQFGSGEKPHSGPGKLLWFRDRTFCLQADSLGFNT